MKSKKVFVLLGIATMTLGLSACSVLDYLDNSSISYPTDNIPTKNPEEDLGSVVTKATKIDPKYTYKDVGTYNIYPLDYTPNIGETKLLIIPIWFTDSNDFIKNDKKESVRKDIETAYLGSNEETGWRSVKTFYEEESSGKLKMSGVVSDWYEVGKSYKYYGENDETTSSLVTTATNWYFTNNPTAKRTDFDGDKNGFLDGVMLIYACPNYVDLDNEMSNLWAYCYWVQDLDSKNISNPQPNVFFWASYDFMYSSRDSLSRTGVRGYGFGDTSHCNVDAHTYIHEMGHAFGLDDYYDYGPYSYSPVGGFTMQDNNVGGHDPFSVFSLGWASPYVISGSDEIIIGTFQKTRDLVLIAPRWNSNDSPFDEYILLELYSPTGLNEFDCTNVYSSYGSKGPTATAVRMWHVDARLVKCLDADIEGNPVFEKKDMTTNPVVGDDSYGVVVSHTNSYGEDGYGSVLGPSEDKYNLLQLIRNNKSETYNTTKQASNDDLFYSSKEDYKLSDYSRQFPDKKFNNGNALNYSINITISGNGEDAQAKIVVKQN